MPISQNTIINVEFQRRGDPDPNVSVGEALNNIGVYEYTWLLIGGVQIRWYGDRNRAARVLTEHLLTALKEGVSQAAPGAPVLTSHVTPRVENRGGARSRK